MTVKEVLNIVIQNLSSICIPAGLVDQVGIPIAQNIHNLRECVKAIDEAEVKTDDDSEG